MDFLSTIVSEGVPITLSSDSHFPDDLGKYVAENKKMLQQLGVYTCSNLSSTRKKLSADPVNGSVFLLVEKARKGLRNKSKIYKRRIQ